MLRILQLQLLAVVGVKVKVRLEESEQRRRLLRIAQRQKGDDAENLRREAVHGGAVEDRVETGDGVHQQADVLRRAAGGGVEEVIGGGLLATRLRHQRLHQRQQLLKVGGRPRGRGRRQQVGGLTAHKEAGNGEHGADGVQLRRDQRPPVGHHLHAVAKELEEDKEQLAAAVGDLLHRLKALQHHLQAAKGS